MHYLVITAIIAAFGVAEIVRSRGDVLARSKQDWIIEVFCFVVMPGIQVPAIVFIVNRALEASVPGARDALAHWSWPAMSLSFVVLDDLTQYLWHRLAHSHPFFWRLHRAHHSATKMGVNVAFRNNFFYYAMMPGIWLSAVLVFLGMGAVYPIYVTLKMTIVFGAHSEARWDRALWRSRWTLPLAWVLERVISTPATHFAHHGRHATDPGTHYKGNYGNMLFVWDLLLGTAKITRTYPREVGVENEPEHGWASQLFWPIAPEHSAVRARDASSSPATAPARRATGA